MLLIFNLRFCPYKAIGSPYPREQFRISSC